MMIKNVLKDLLHEHDINIAQLARATKVPRQTLDNWLSGQEPRSLKQLRKVADYFDVTMDYLCFGIVAEVKEPLHEYEEEIFAGKFDVILRRVKK